MITAPSTGLIDALDADIYHSLPGVSASGMKEFFRSPAHYRVWLKEKPEPTPAMRIGTLAHLAVLEPAAFRAKTVVAPVVDRRTKDGKAIWEQFLAENAGKEVITADEREMLVGMGDAVETHRVAVSLLTSGRPEVSAFATHESTGLALKGRFDWFNQDAGIIVDLKTTDDASPSGFAKAIAAFKYHLQAAHYMQLATLNGIDHPKFRFIAVEKKPPYAVAVYDLDVATIEFADRELSRILEALASCQAFDSWPGYAEDIQTISLPKWTAHYQP